MNTSHTWSPMGRLFLFSFFFFSFYHIYCSSSHNDLGQADGPTDPEAMWVQKIGRDKDNVTLHCPQGHVLYRPQLVLGAHATDMEITRTVSEQDCLGVAPSTMSQVYGCYWQQSCSLTWQEGLTIVTSSNYSCVGKVANYVILTNPLCLPSGHVFTMCEGEEQEVPDVPYGVVRSHRSFPAGPVRRWNSPRWCRVKLSVKRGHTLTLHLQHLSLATTDTLTIFHVTHIATSILRDTRHKSDDEVIFSVTSGRIVIDYVISASSAFWVVGPTPGFVIKFEQQPCQYQRQAAVMGQSAQRVAAFGHSQFQVRAVISRCLPNNLEWATLTCPPQYLIYRPDVRQGSSTHKRKCGRKADDCHGETHSLLVQRHKCYWRTECRLSWGGVTAMGVPMILTDRPSCMAVTPSYVDLGPAHCLHKDSVHNLCDKTYWNIRATHGYIVSHRDFPWNYGHQPHICRKRICVHRKFGLRISSDDLDLSPYAEEGDELKIWRVTEDNKRELVNVYRQKQTVEECFTSGCVDVEFRKRAGHNRGRGFVLQLGSVVPVTDQSSDYTWCGTLRDGLRIHRQQVWMAAHSVSVFVGVGTWSCVDKTTFNMTAEEMKKSFRVKCGRGKLITGLSVVGHNDSCQGLTPSMFVQMASCHWKNMCKLHYSTKAINFMIKVFNNSNSFLCVLKTPDFFTISYQCSKKKGQPYDVWWIGEDQIVEDKKGILRSHSDHPWLYRRGHDLDFKEKVTVRRPQKDKRLKILQYTIRSLNLMSGDNLTVTWYTTQKQVKTFQGNVQLSDNVRKRTFHIKDSVGEVKFALKTSLHTTGGDGFVICFKWTKTANRKDTCRSLIAPKKCVS